MKPGTNVIKLLIAVIYCNFIVIPSFSVIKQYYHTYYHGLALNYHGIFISQYGSNKIPQY
jgi:hypothetical protein